jgi:zinc protease
MSVHRLGSPSLIRTIAAVLAVSVFTLTASAQQAQQPLDRKKIPVPGRAPELRVPLWTRAKLANGADLMVSEKHNLPLVSFSLTFLGGSNQFEPPSKTGLASMTAAMMSEGTTTREAEALSKALQSLGTTVSTSIGGESGSISFVSTAGKFARTLEILADILLNPTFPAASLERIRAQRLVALTQGKAQPDTIANRVFPRILYGTEHPYGRVTTEASIESVTRDDVAAFHKSYFQPGRALVTIVGDVDASVLKSQIENALRAWPAGGERPTFEYPPPPPISKTTIFLVDKPGAAQSIFSLGHPGPARNTPDYFALEVMNTLLGGMFQSRLNANIREDKGYSYSVSSDFSFGKGPGPFSAGGDIVSAKSDVALVEFMKELRGIQGSRPVTDDELKTAKDSLIQSLPSAFASVEGINGAMTNIWNQGLPDDYYKQYASKVTGVTKADVVRVARKYIDLGHLAIVIVGDRASIEGPLKATGIAPIEIVDPI